ncbi:MAG: hypothetical protein PWR06_2353 [Thermoanaerobacteraceae bacterium]|nr:hypothetical protein [Thermoanaerobacteraceae bacterium]
MKEQAICKAGEPKPRLIEIKMSRYTLFMTEAEILSLMAKDQELWAKAIGRGKALLRHETARKREAKGFNRWMLYELFKGNRPIDDTAIEGVANMDEKELREGIIEILLLKKRGEVK